MKHKLALLSLVLLSALPSSLAAHSSFHSPHLTSVFNTHVPPAKPYHVALSLPIPLEVYSSLVPGSVWSLITSQPAPLFLGALLITFVAVGALSAVLTGSKNQQLDAPKTFKEAVNKVEAFAKATPLATVAELAAFSKAAFQEAGVTLTPGDQEAFTVLLTDLVASKNVTPIPPGLMQDDVLNKLVKFSSATPLATVAELMTFSEEAFQEAGVTLTPRDREVFTSFLTEYVASKKVKQNVKPLAIVLTPEDVLVNKLIAFAKATPLVTVAELMTFAEAAFQEAGLPLKAYDKTELEALLTQFNQLGSLFEDETLPEEARLSRAVLALVPTTDAAYQAAFAESVQRIEAYKEAFTKLESFRAAQLVIADALPIEAEAIALDEAENFKLKTALIEAVANLGELDNLAALREAIQRAKLQAIINVQPNYVTSLEQMEIELLATGLTDRAYTELEASLLNGFQDQIALQQLASSLKILPGSNQASLEQFKASLLVRGSKQAARDSLEALGIAWKTQNATEITKQIGNMETALAQLAAKADDAQALAKQLGAKTKLAMLEEAQAAKAKEALSNFMSTQKLLSSARDSSARDVNVSKLEAFFNSQEAFKKLVQLKKFTASDPLLNVNDAAKTTEQLAKIQSARKELVRLPLERAAGDLEAIDQAFRDFTDSVTELTS